MGKKNTQNAKKLSAKERRVKVAVWYEGGATIRQIADKLTEMGFPVSKSTVSADLQIIYAELDAKSEEFINQMRIRQNGRYDSLIRANWKKANEGDFKAGMLVEKLMNGQNDLLGLKAAKKIEHGGEIKVNNVRDLSDEELQLIVDSKG